jgi:hypothetical protein
MYSFSSLSDNPLDDEIPIKETTRECIDACNDNNCAVMIATIHDASCFKISLVFV